MHELSVAQSLIDHIARSVPQRDLPKIMSVCVRLGAVSGVVKDSLEFSFTALTAGTTLENVRMEFEERPYVVHCRSCDSRTSNDLGIAVCEACGSTETTVESGTELDIVYLELNDESDSP